MNICKKCGYVFYDEEIEIHNNCACCPVCSGSFTEAVKCEICDDYFLPSQVHGGACEYCIDEYRYDFETCYEIGKGSTEKVELNWFIATTFTPQEIEDILYEALVKEKKIFKKIDCEKFINEDKLWFGESLVEFLKGGGNNENTKV